MCELLHTFAGHLVAANRAAKEAAEALVRVQKKRPRRSGALHRVFAEEASAAGQFATRQLVPERKAPPKRGVSGDGSRPLNLSSVKDADRQPLVTTGAGGGYLPIGALPTGHLPTGGGAGGGVVNEAAERRAAVREVCVPPHSAARSVGSLVWVVTREQCCHRR